MSSSGRALVTAGMVLAMVTVPAQVAPGSPGAQEPANPELVHRPPPKQATRVAPEGRIHLDVVVDDAAGAPMTGLEPWDFKLLDNDQPDRILSFRAYDGVNVHPQPPVEVILVIDTVNLPFQQVGFVRQQLEQFLRGNGGRLQQPTALFLLTDSGLRVQPRFSTDGNVVAQAVHQINGSVRTVDSSAGGEGDVERFQICARQLANIAENEARKPGRKLLIWVGPGWPMLNNSAPGTNIAREQQHYFDAIVELSTRMREARMVLYSVAPANIGAGGTDALHTQLYRSFLKGVKSPREADSGNLALKVLATQTGGQVMGPDNNLVAQIDRCIADANVFYTLSFNPPLTQKRDEYHELKVVVDKPGAVARTNSGYYNQPPGQ